MGTHFGASRVCHYGENYFSVFFIYIILFVRLPLRSKYTIFIFILFLFFCAGEGGGGVGMAIDNHIFLYEFILRKITSGRLTGDACTRHCIVSIGTVYAPKSWVILSVEVYFVVYTINGGILKYMLVHCFRYLDLYCYCIYLFYCYRFEMKWKGNKICILV